MIGEEEMELMDCSSSLLHSSHHRPATVDSGIEAKRRKIDDDIQQIQTADSKGRLAQLRWDIKVLEAAVRDGQEKIEKMLQFTEENRQFDYRSHTHILYEECDELVDDLNSAEQEKASEFEEQRVQQMEDGSVLVSLWDHTKRNGYSPSFVKVEKWEMSNCGCRFCGFYRPSRDELPPRV